MKFFQGVKSERTINEIAIKKATQGIFSEKATLLQMERELKLHQNSQLIFAKQSILARNAASKTTDSNVKAELIRIAKEQEGEDITEGHIIVELKARIAEAAKELEYDEKSLKWAGLKNT